MKKLLFLLLTIIIAIAVTSAVANNKVWKDADGNIVQFDDGTLDVVSKPNDPNEISLPLETLKENLLAGIVVYHQASQKIDLCIAATTQSSANKKAICSKADYVFNRSNKHHGYISSYIKTPSGKLQLQEIFDAIKEDYDHEVSILYGKNQIMRDLE